MAQGKQAGWSWGMEGAEDPGRGQGKGGGRRSGGGGRAKDTGWRCMGKLGLRRARDEVSGVRGWQWRPYEMPRGVLCR